MKTSSSKSTKVVYWIFTALLVIGLLISSIPGLLGIPEATAFITGLGYPAYIVQFLDIAKLLAVVAILVQGFPRVKEWAYAGIAFDLIGATYSQIAKAMPPQAWGFMSIWFVVLIISYIYYHKILKTKAA